MAASSFAAEVSAFAKKVPRAVEAVFRNSVRTVVADMQAPTTSGGRMRVKTGFLRASLMSSTSAMPAIDSSARPVSGGRYPTDFGRIEAAIAAASPGSTLYFGYTAAYAGHREYGAGGQAPDGFVRLAVQNWPAIVARAAAELKV